MGFECATRTHVGHRRKVNEDALLACTERQLWAVADGMGGHHAGDVASAMVVAALAKVPDGSSFENFVGKALAALEVVNQELVELSINEFEQRTIGSTVVGLMASASEYRCFWVGDSRAYRIRSGTLTQLTRDHSLVQDLVDAGMIDPEQAETHPNANVVTRAVGAAGSLRIDSVGGEVQTGDMFLLASDGLTKLVKGDELLTMLSGDNLELAADRLLDLSLERGAPDNVTLVLVRVQ